MGTKRTFLPSILLGILGINSLNANNNPSTHNSSDMRIISEGGNNNSLPKPNVRISDGNNNYNNNTQPIPKSTYTREEHGKYEVKEPFAKTFPDPKTKKEQMRRQHDLINIFRNKFPKALIIGFGWCADYSNGKLTFACDPEIRLLNYIEDREIISALREASRYNQEVRNQFRVVFNLLKIQIEKSIRKYGSKKNS